MVFDVATQIALLSEAITLSPGDIFVTVYAFRCRVAIAAPTNNSHV